MIATDSGGAAEEIVEGVNGNVVPLGDEPGPLVKAITDALDSADTIRSHVNPFKDLIATLEDQAEELHDILAGIVVQQDDQETLCFRRFAQVAPWICRPHDRLSPAYAAGRWNFDIGSDSNS